MKFIELFAGIGGFRLGLERAGHTCVWANEIDPYACKVYRKNWPDGTLHEGDIRSVDPAVLPDYDLLVGGFPCQPVSLAGRRKAQKDPRWLWPEIFRLVRATRPRWVMLENVPGLFSGGFGDVLRDLASLGYDAEWDCISAASVGAPHIRYRVFIVAYPAGERRDEGWPESEIQRRPASALIGGASVADAQSPERRPGHSKDGRGARPHRLSQGQEGSGRARARRSHVADAKGKRERSGLRSGGAGQGGESSHGRGEGNRQGARGFCDWSIEPNVGRVAHGIPSRVDRLTCLGNAVVPQVVETVARMYLPE